MSYCHCLMIGDWLLTFLSTLRAFFFTSSIRSQALDNAMASVSKRFGMVAVNVAALEIEIMQGK